MEGSRSTVYYIDSRQVTLPELRKLRRFAGGAYAFSAAGLLKATAAVALLASGVAFAAAPSCASAPTWYAALPPALQMIAGLLLLAMYMLFVLGFAESNLKAWVVGDLVLLCTEACMAVAASALALGACDKKDSLHFVPAVTGLVAALVIRMDGAVVWAMWRVGEEDLGGGGGGAGGGMPGEGPPPRKSIFL